MYDNQSIRQGATLPLTVENDETGATTATITLSQDDAVVLTKTASFVGLTADISLSATDTLLPVGVYDYMITVVNDDDTVDKYPDTANCTDCELPTIEICVANDVEVS